MGCDIFQSTGPLRDPTICGYVIQRLETISIHRSLAGPDVNSGHEIINQNISIHRSLAGPDRRNIRSAWVRSISIHRSLAGPDRRAQQVVDKLKAFQSTGPLRDPTHCI